MGTCNALRTTETYTTENFTLIQLEEERQKLKKKELLKNMLTDGEFSIKGQCAINLMMTKLEIINTFLLMKYNRSFIQMTTGRLKSYDSVCKKMQKKGLDLNFAQALEKINDLIGVRAVCSYVDDIYKVADLIEKQQDIRILKTKDYIRQPKKSGYQSLHLILEVAMPFQNESQWIKVELQLRTAAMDYWANLDHQLRYLRVGFLGERAERNYFVDTRKELGAQELPQTLHCALLGHILGCLAETYAVYARALSCVGGHGDNGILKAYISAVGIGYLALVQYLEQDIHYIGVSLFNLVEQDYGIWLSADALSQLSRLVIADISGRRADYLGNAVLLHVLRHIKPDKRIYRP